MIGIVPSLINLSNQKGIKMSVKNIIAGLMDLGVSYDDLMDAIEDQKPKKSAKKPAKGKSSKPAKEDKPAKGKSKKKNEPELLSDLSDSELKQLAEDLELASPKKLKKMDREELVELLADEDEDEIEDLIEELFGDSDDKDEEDEDEGDEDEDDEDEDGDEDEDEDVDFYEMSVEELVEEVVKRGLAKKAKAKKMDEDELIDLLELDD